jgi:serine/threonine protein phosphatase PrpC
MSSFVSRGTCYLVAKADEDKLCTYQRNEKNLAAFGVFDGHGGKEGSSTCAREMIARTLSEFECLEKAKATAAKSDADVSSLSYDNLICMAADKASMDLNIVIQDCGKSGSTSCVLYTQKQTGGNVRATCMNTGDSRCVMLQYTADGYAIADMSVDHNVKMKTEIMRLQSKEFLPTFQSLGPLYLTEPPNGLTNDSDNKLPQQAASMNAIAVVKQNRDLIELANHLDFYFSSHIVQNPGLQSLGESGDLDATVHSICIGDDAESYAANSMNQDGPPSHASSHSSINLAMLSEEKSLATEEEDANLRSKKSFIGTRVDASGAPVGPKALFGRHNISTLMTRSIGDKLAARSCIPNPDCRAVDIGADEFVRFVIASDGLWDVMSSQGAAEFVARMGDVQKAAELLAKKGKQKRQDRAMRMDDISVIVVDVNPQNMGAFGVGSAGTGCTCTIS